MKSATIKTLNLAVISSRDYNRFPARNHRLRALRLDNTQFAASLNGIFQGWDVSFYVADIDARERASFTDLSISEITLPK